MGITITLEDWVGLKDGIGSWETNPGLDLFADRLSVVVGLKRFVRSGG